MMLSVDGSADHLISMMRRRPELVLIQLDDGADYETTRLCTTRVHSWSRCKTQSLYQLNKTFSHLSQQHIVPVFVL